MKLKVKKLHPAAELPQYATPGAACFDLVATSIEGDTVNVVHGYPLVIGTGLAFEVPPGFAMLIFSRSGHGFNHSTRLANCVGVIDSDYRGEVKIRLSRDHDNRRDGTAVHVGERVAQAMVIPVPSVEFVTVSELGETARGKGGFGSTGK